MTAFFFILSATLLLISILTAKSAFQAQKSATGYSNLTKVILSAARINLEKVKRLANDCSFGTLPSEEELARLVELAKANPRQRTHILSVLNEVLEENNVID